MINNSLDGEMVVTRYVRNNIRSVLSTYYMHTKSHTIPHRDKKDKF